MRKTISIDNSKVNRKVAPMAIEMTNTLASLEGNRGVAVGAAAVGEGTLGEVLGEASTRVALSNIVPLIQE